MNIQIAKPCCFTQVGKRPNQEDSLYPPLGTATEQQRVFLVCDGMGGHSHGEIASNIVANTIGQALDRATVQRSLCMSEMQEAFVEALNEARAALDEADDEGNEERKMGTTLTLLALCTDGCLAIHIGDSRIYQFRKGQGIVFRTTDHTLVNQLIALGEMTPEEALTSPSRHTLTKAVMPHQQRPSQPEITKITQVQPGDRFLLCSDGVYEQISDEELTTLFTQNDEDAQQQLQQCCTQRETHDNHTAYIVNITKVNYPNNEASPTKPKKRSFWQKWLGMGE